MKDLAELVVNSGIMPTMFAEDMESIPRVIRAVERTEMPVVEILQRGEAAFACLQEALRCRKTALIGAGTICDLKTCKKMVEAGADFIVSPGFNPEIVDWCAENGVTVVPGCTTPSEVMLACNAGVKILKFFPFNELGGIDYLNGIAGPFPQAKFVISGCLDDRDLHYLCNPHIAGVTAVYFFQGEEDHTILPEDEIVHRINVSIDIAKHYRKGWEG